MQILQIVRSILMILVLFWVLPVSAQDEDVDVDALLEQADQAAGIAEGEAEQVIEADGAAHPEYVMPLWMLIGIVVAVLLVYLALIIWTARDARRRGLLGRRRFLWVLTVILLGLLGWILYLFFRPALNK